MVGPFASAALVNIDGSLPTLPTAKPSVVDTTISKVGDSITSGAGKAVTGALTGVAANVINSSLSTGGLESGAAGLAQKCVTNVLAQKAVSIAGGAIIGVISWAILMFSIPIAVPSNDQGTGSGAILQSVEGAATFIQGMVKPMGDCLIHGATQMAIDTLNTQILGFIQTGGFNGNPLFAVSLANFTQSLSSATAKGVANQIRQPGAVANFTPGYQQGLANRIEQSSRKDADRKFAKQIRSPFEAINVDPQAFYQSSNNKGGWSYEAHEAGLGDNGNPTGVELLSNGHREARTEEAQEVQTQKLAQSGGFLGVVDPSKCDYPEGTLAGWKDLIDSEKEILQQTYCRTTTPGKTIGDQLTQTVGSDISRLVNTDKTMQGFVANLAKEAGAGFFK